MTASESASRRPGELSITDTARWVAFYRAMESERPDRLFNDPYARSLAGVRGEEIIKTMRFGRAFATPNIVRTKVMDEVITECLSRDKVDFVVNLAAGLDSRPYRMDLPSDLTWVEADYPEIIEYKSQILASQTPRCKLERFGIDLADVEARRVLLAQIKGCGRKGLIVSEGLLIYLSPEQVAGLAQDLSGQPNFSLWLLDIVAPFAVRMMRGVLSKRLQRSSAEFKFAPAQGAGFFEPFGWKLRVYRSAFLDGRRYHREPPGAWIWHLFFSRAARKEIDRRTGPMTGTVLLERIASAPS